MKLTHPKKLALPTSAQSRSDRIMREIRWLFILLLLSFYIAALLSYNPVDSAWSRVAADDAMIKNWGGVLGAYVADIALYLFGRSAWWTVFGITLSVLHHYWTLRQAIRHPEHSAAAPHRATRIIGFVLLMMGSVIIEFFSKDSIDLPFGHGGLSGYLLGHHLHRFISFYPTIGLAFALWLMGMSLFIQVSWLRLAEAIGNVVEWLGNYVLTRWQTWRDRRLGESAAAQRETQVRIERARISDADEVAIIAPPPETELPKITQQRIQARVQAEKQDTLFVNTASLPPLHLLDPIKPSLETVSKEHIELTSRLIERKLAEFGVTIKVITAQPGPVITRYEIEPASGVKGSQVVNLARDLARALSLTSIRVVETIPGKNFMGLELPNPKRNAVQLAEIISSATYNASASMLTMALGKDIAGSPIVADLARMPHLLVAGTTGSGKSVGINAMILSLLYKATEEQVRLILIDPKMLEMASYEDIPHLIAPVVTDMRQAANALNWCVGEMERRYRLMSKLGVRNLAGYNQKISAARQGDHPLTNPFSLTPDTPEPLETLPHIVIVIDELADLIMVIGKKIEELIARIAQKARAAGIHLILATQRPSVDVITGLIKANVPTRMAFQVSSKIDSRTILDQMGAESLLGMGDMLYLPPGTGLPQRVHGAFVSDEEVLRVVEYLKQKGPPQYIEGVLEGGTGDDDAGQSGIGDGVDGEKDPLYDEAVDLVLKSRRASISFVQQKLRIGYNRSARLLEQMENSGLITSMQSNGQRQVIASGDTQ